MNGSLDCLFPPAVIAHVVASERGIYPAEIFQNLLTYTYEGKVYPVNPGRTSVQSKPCYPSIEALPERPDLVLIKAAYNGKARG